MANPGPAPRHGLDVTKRYPQSTYGQIPSIETWRYGQSAPAAQAPSQTATAQAACFVRVRPLIKEELDSGAEVLAGMAACSSADGLEPAAVIALETSAGTVIGGYDAVLGPEADNAEVFARAVAPRLDVVLRGGCASLFCYGYTGSGKSHTVLGYGQERGLYDLAARELLQRLDGERFLVATAAEVYGDAVFDLLGEERLPAALRTDVAGNLVVCGAAKPMELAVPAAAEGVHATLVTRTTGLRRAIVREAEDLKAVAASAVSGRSTGSSTTHEQSSRSHAVLRLEVCDAPLLEAREELEEARALLPALMNAADNLNSTAYKGLLDMERMAREYEEAKQQGWRQSDLEAEDSAPGSTEKGGDGAGKEAARKAGKAKYAAEVHLRQYPGGQAEWDDTYDAIKADQAALTAALEAAQAQLNAAQERYSSLQARQGSSALGGCLVLVDLAGADYDDRDVGIGGHTMQQKKESAAINKSLLALKECLRSLARAPACKPRPPFRDCKLTRILEEALSPSARLESTSVMLVNVSPAASLERMTTNTLRYGQLFTGRAASTAAAAVATTGTQPGVACGAAGVAKPWLQKRQNAGAAPLDGAALVAVLEELRVLYAEHCPEKSSDEVEGILTKWGGRECELLAKARAKYVAVVL